MLEKKSVANRANREDLWNEFTRELKKYYEDLIVLFQIVRRIPSKEVVIFSMIILSSRARF